MLNIFKKRICINIDQAKFGTRDIKILSNGKDDIPTAVEYKKEIYKLDKIDHLSDIPDKDIILLYRSNQNYFKIELNALAWRSY